MACKIDPDRLAEQRQAETAWPRDFSEQRRYLILRHHWAGEWPRG